jgi:MFS transporter, PAT family, beta-lactamase induction signal transducer AmpG
VIDAYRIEAAPNEMQTLMSGSYVAGYRIGMLLSGAGALYLASKFGSTMGAYDYSAWHNTYMAMSALMLIGIITTLVVSEPDHSRASKHQYSNEDYLRLCAAFVISVLVFIGWFYLSSPWVSGIKSAINLPDSDFKTANLAVISFVLESIRLITGLAMAAAAGYFMVKFHMVNQSMVEESYVNPVKDFFHRYGLKPAILILCLVGLYRISDIVLGVIANVFYQDLGFTKTEIATIVKTFGLVMTILGGFLGGVLALRFGVMRLLLVGAVLTVITNLLFIMLAKVGHNTAMLYLVISADNLTAGIASSVFIAFLSRLTNIKFTATQYAIFSSLMTLIPKVIGGYSGAMVDLFGYETFFWIAALIGVPIILLVLMVGRIVEFKSEP